jgi:hypothetical protein
LRSPFAELIHRFFQEPPPDSGRITNERALQLELALYFRKLGYGVEFEVYMRAARLAGSTLRPKFNLDLLVRSNEAFGIELKVPLNGQHPETMYAYCADLEFLESLRRARLITRGCCLIVTNDRAFWADSGRGSPIHDSFRRPNGSLCGIIRKPTGARDTCVQLESIYSVATAWRPIRSEKLLPDGQYALVEV